MFGFKNYAAIILVFLFCLSAHAQHDWEMSITVDNQYEIYFGDQFLSVPTFVGGDNNFSDVETFSITGVDPSAFLYVVTASDFSVAQGFLGSFLNLTTSETFETSAASGSQWEVFPAGKFLQQLNAIDSSFPVGSWPASVQPTVAQIQTAVSYATNNSLWVPPASAPNYANSDNPSPWSTISGISGSAEWIWHDSGLDTSTGGLPVPFRGFNHEEFLIFRIAGTAASQECTFESNNLLCDLDGEGQPTGDFVITGEFTNLQDIPGTHLFLLPNATPQGVEVCFGNGQQGMQIDPPLNNGDSYEVGSDLSNFNAIIVKNAMPGDEVCFTMTLLGENGVECCTLEACFVMPPCDCLQVDRRFDEISEVVCNADGTVDFSYSFQLTNLFGMDVFHSFLGSLGDELFLPDFFDLLAANGNVALAQGQSVQLKTAVTGAMPGDLVDFLITIHNEDLSECCTRPHDVLAPECEDAGSQKNVILLGDMNVDGVVNLIDVQPFVELLSSGVFMANGDVNEDGAFDLNDVAPFVGLLTGSP